MFLLQSNTRRCKRSPRIYSGTNEKHAAKSNTHSDMNLCHCNDPDGCVTLQDILNYFNAAISEEQAWALIYQSVCMYRNALYYKLNEAQNGRQYDIRLLNDTRNFNVHRDGTVHIAFSLCESINYISSEQQILSKLAFVVFQALDYNCNLCNISNELESILEIMSNDANDDEGIGNDSVDSDDHKLLATKELNLIIDLCNKRVNSSANIHYNAVCRALATESIELRVFLQKISCGDTNNLHFIANTETSKQELLTLPSSDWSRLWMQVIEQLRNGVRLRKCSYEQPSLEFKLTPYEILMDDIRLKNYNLRKVIVSSDVPNRMKLDAHAMILEFIRSRPPLKRVSDRKLLARQRSPTPREELMDSIRCGRVLKHITPRIKTTLLTPMVQSENRYLQNKPNARNVRNLPQRNKQRLIRVDPELFKDDDLYSYNDSPSPFSLCSPNAAKLNYLNNENNANGLNANINRVSKLCNDSKTNIPSSPISRPNSYLNRKKLFATTSTNTSILNKCSQLKTLDEDVIDGPSKNYSNDQVTLTMKEVVHMRFVRSKIILDNIDNQIKDDVENKHICFQCLETRFNIILWERGAKCQLCCRTVCSKCHSKERIPVDCFRKVPVSLLSPKSLMNIDNKKTSIADNFNKNVKGRLTKSRSVDNPRCHWYPSLQSRKSNESPPHGEIMSVCLDCSEFVSNILRSNNELENTEPN